MATFQKWTLLHHIGAILTLVFLALVALCTPAHGEQHTITLDAVPATTCNDPWVEAGCPLSFAVTTAEDHNGAGFCLLANHYEQGSNVGVVLFPARLEMDLSTMSGIETIEVDIYEANEAGFTRAFLYNMDLHVDTAQSTQTLNHTITLQTQGQKVDRFAISGQETGVWEIRVLGTNLVANGVERFGTLKGMFR